MVQILVQELVLFLNHEPWFFLWSDLGNPNLTGLVTLTQPTAISCIINTVSQFFGGTQAQLAETPPQRHEDGFMRLSFKKPVIMFRTSPISSLRTLATRTSPSCSTRTPSSPTLWCLPSGKTPQAKVLGAWFYSSFEHCCAAPSSSTFRDINGHIVLSTHSHCRCQEAFASTDLLQRLHGCMKQDNVDFIGGDFNMSAFFTVGDVFSDTEFSAPGNSFLWGLGALEEQYRECIGFLIMPKSPYDWRVDSHGCYKYDNAALAFGPRDQTAHLPVFLHLRTTNLPGPTALCAANTHNKEEWNAGITNMTVREEDGLDCDVVHQCHVSAHIFILPCRSFVSHLGPVVSHHIDARTFCFKSLSRH